MPKIKKPLRKRPRQRAFLGLSIGWLATKQIKQVVLWDLSVWDRVDSWVGGVKEIKQNLKIKSFCGTSKNAVWTQILIAMIVYLLYMLLKQNKSNFKNFTLFCNELPLILFQTKHLSRWFSKKKKPKPKKKSLKCVFLMFLVAVYKSLDNF